MHASSGRSKNMFKGSIVALVTPFDEAGEIDFRAWSNLISLHLDAGSDGLVVAGTTGESATLRAGEFEQLLATAVGQVSGQVPVIAGTGSACTEKALALTRLAAAGGADAALVVTPYYNRPTQHGLLAHFTEIADHSNIPLILYNVPSRTSVDMLPETVQALAGHERIVGVKEAVGQMQRVEELLRLCGDGFTVLSGDDPTCLQAMRRGASGVISVAANAAPDRFQRMCAAALEQDWGAAELEEAQLQPLLDALMLETNPIPVKWAVHERALCLPNLRLPLTTLSEPHRAAVRNSLVALQYLPQ